MINEQQCNSIEQEQHSLPITEPDKTNTTQREKRVRKPKQYDNDFITFNTINTITKSEFNIGDLVWAKLSGHPWWPCMVSAAPNSSLHYRLMGASRPKRYVYVEFFGPGIEHAWISEPSLIDYQGVDSFKIYAQDQVDQATAKSAKEKLADKYQLKVSLAKRDQWEKAVTEADNAMNITLDERIQLFNSKLAESRASDSEHHNLLDHNEDSQMSTCSTQSNKRKNSGDLTSDIPIEMNRIKKKTISSDETVEETSNKNEEEEEEEDENNSLTLSKILLDVANNQNKNEINDFFIDKLTSNHNKITDEYDEEESEQKEDEDDESYNSEDMEEDTSDENYSDVEKINKKKQSVNPRIRTFNQQPQQQQPIIAIIDPKISKRSDVINAFGLRQRTHKGQHANEEDLTESDASSIASSESLLIYQPDHLTKTKQKRAYNKQTPKKYKPKKNQSTLNSSIESLIVKVNDDQLELNKVNPKSTSSSSTAETYLIDRYKYAVRHIRQGLSVEEACNKYRISKGALLKCLSGGTAPRGKKTRLTELEENEIVEWLINNKDLKYNEAIHLVFEQVEQIFQIAKRPNPFHNGKPSMDWWYDFLSRHPQIMASKPEWLRRGKVNDQYIRDVQSGKLRCTKFRRALLSAIQYIRSLTDAAQIAADTAQTVQQIPNEQLFQMNTVNKSKLKIKNKSSKEHNKVKKSTKLVKNKTVKCKLNKESNQQMDYFNKENRDKDLNNNNLESTNQSSNNNYLDRLVASLISDYADKSENEDENNQSLFATNESSNILNCLQNQQELNNKSKQSKIALIENNLINSMITNEEEQTNFNQHFLITNHNTNDKNNNHLLVTDDQDDDEYYLMEHYNESNKNFITKNDYQEEEEDDEEEEENEEESDEEEDGQTLVTTLNEFA